MSAAVFIYCDSNRHPGRVVPVRGFGRSRRDEGRWHELATRTVAEGQTESFVTLEGNRPLEQPRQRPGSGERNTYRLVCPLHRCQRHPVEVTEEKFFAALNILSEHGASEVSLTLLAATLQRQSEERRADRPAPGQG